MTWIEIGFFSQSLGMCVSANVLLPDHRNEQGLGRARRFPTLYLLHGAFGDHNDWMRLTAIERYARQYDISVVMPGAQNSGYANQPGGLNFYDYIALELPKKMEAFFPLSKKREDRFIAGLSMGGYGALAIGLSQSKRYAAIGCLSAGSGALPRALASKLVGGVKRGRLQHDLKSCLHLIQEKQLPKPRIYHAVGKEDFILDNARNFANIMRGPKGRDFDYSYIEDSGGHTWDYWDRHIQLFLHWLQAPKADSAR